jgi:large subunit ribosomal protein L16
MFEVPLPTEQVAREDLLGEAHKLPMKCRIIRREAGDQ